MTIQVGNTCCFRCKVCGRLITILGQIYRCQCGQAYKVESMQVSMYNHQEINWMIQNPPEA